MKTVRRPALKSDKDFCRQIHHRAYRTVCERQFGPWNERVQDDFFEKDWNANAEGFEILLCDGVPCGYLRVEVSLDRVQVHEIVIDPGFQNRGIGTFFMRQIMAQAQTLSLPLHLQTLHQNRAFEFYRRIGFKETGRTGTHTLLEWEPAETARRL